MRKLALCVLGAAVLFGSATGVDARERLLGGVVNGPLGKQIDEMIQRETKGGFWGAVLVAKDGKVLIAKGYGFADYGQQRNETDTFFEIASLSKQVTATAILKLEQQGKLKTSDTLAKFFADLPEDKQDMEVYHLLTHTSGLSRELGVPYSSPLDRKAYVKHILTKPRTHAPGTHFSYSNVGYALLACIVEEVTGGTFEDYCRKHLFEPAGLEDTGFVGDKRIIDSGRVASRLGNGPKAWSAANWHWGWGYRGMGGVVTTINDLLKWDLALRGDKVLGDEAKKKLYEPFERGYACGWNIEKTARGTTSVNHGGGVMGFRCIMDRDLDDDVVIIALTNGGGNPHQVRKIAQEVLHPSPKLEAIIDVGPHTLSKSRAVELETGAKWEVEKTTSSTALMLKDEKGHALATIRMPSSYVGKVLSQLERAIAVRKRGEDDAKSPIEGGIYFAAYPKGKTRLELDQKLEIQVMPEYRGMGQDGKVIVDRRVLFILTDAQYRMWPMMVKMNVEAAEALRNALK